MLLCVLAVPVRLCNGRMEIPCYLMNSLMVEHCKLVEQHLSETDHPNLYLQGQSGVHVPVKVADCFL